MNLEHYNYIVVEGPIGVGKTTLATKLAKELNARLLLEQPLDNPFLERFYRDAQRYALPTQMAFLFQRMAQLRSVTSSAPDSTPIVADYLLDKDALFARLTLPDDELQLYQQLYDHLRPRTPVPDLVIYLQAEPTTLIERIRQRGIEMEADISAEYMTRLCDSYSRFFYDYDAAPLLIVNNEHLELADSDADFTLLLERIGSMRGKREFFNRGD